MHGLRADQECHMKRTKNSILESEQYRAVGGAQSHTKILALIRTNEGPKQSIDAANITSDNPTTDLVFTWALPLQQDVHWHQLNANEETFSESNNPVKSNFRRLISSIKLNQSAT